MLFHQVALAPNFVRPWTQLVTSWRSRLAKWLNPYRPELHYMRGPGPKCRAKLSGGLLG
jgi:hypothetical protein